MATPNLSKTRLKLCRMYWRLMLRQPLNVLALIVLAAAAQATVFVETLGQDLQLGLRCALQLSVLGLGGLFMADLISSDRKLLMLMAERGAIVPMGKTAVTAFAGAWFALCLPAVLSGLTPTSAQDTVLQIIVLLAAATAIANATYGLVQFSEQKRFFEVGIWTASVLVSVFLAGFITLGIWLLNHGATLRQQELLMLGYTGLISIVSHLMLRKYLHQLPRSPHGA